MALLPEEYALQSKRIGATRLEAKEDPTGGDAAGRLVQLRERQLWCTSGQRENIPPGFDMLWWRDGTGLEGSWSKTPGECAE